MKPKLGFLAALALLVTLGLVLLTGKRAVESHEKPAERVSAEVENHPLTTPSPRGHLLSLRTLISAPIRNESSEMARLSPECRAFESDLFGMGLEKIEYPSQIERLPNPVGCSPSNPKAAKILRYYTNQCSSASEPQPRPSLSKAEWEAKYGNCYLALVLARSTLAALARETKPVGEIADMRELADLLVSGFGEMFTAMSPTALKNLQATADRMAEIDPKLLPAVKAGAMAAMLDAVMKKEARSKGNEETEAPDWAGFERRIAEVEELNPEDPDLDFFRRMARTSGMNPELVKQDSLARLEKDPGNWHEQEILAWANWRLGRTDEARSILSRAARLNLEDPELQANWKAVRKPGAKLEDFKMQMKIGVSLTDLLR